MRIPVRVHGAAYVNTLLVLQCCSSRRLTSAHSCCHCNILLHACRVLDLADNFNQRVLFLWCHASRQQCYQRVYEQHAWNDTEQRREARLRFINEAIGRWFCGVAGEDRDAVLHNYENGLY
jgi:hypothetical protein